MNREELHRRFLKVNEGFANTDLNFSKLEKSIDKIYVRSLTHIMMWDVLLGLLDKQGIITKMQFDEAMKELSERTQAAMEAEQKKKAEAATPKVTVLSDVPAIPIIK